jgi:hypothetical protein
MSESKNTSSWVRVTTPNDEAVGDSEMARLLTQQTEPPSTHSSNPEQAPVVATAVLPEPETTESSSNNSEQQLANTPEKARMASSGTAGCILGCLIGGPLLAILAGFGFAYAAVNKEGPTGDIARACGDIALSTKEKVMELEEKHHIVHKTKRVTANAWENAKEIDSQYNVCEKTKTVIVTGGKAAVEFIVKLSSTTNDEQVPPPADPTNS